jgi:uncharacterized glyoxalase superfamily protein PhnB
MWRWSATECASAWHRVRSCPIAINDRPPLGVELVLEVDDLHADHDRVTSAGWALVEDLTVRPWGLSDFRLLDPAGYYWRLTTRSSPQP